MAQILNPYKIPQVVLSSTAIIWVLCIKQRDGGPSSLLPHGPAEGHQYLVIISLLKHFGWTWIGLFVVEGDQGEFFLQAMETLFSTHGICAGFTR
ncbi:Taste receptor type 1 member 1 [Varanus komodoensis]|nr:Taste receptor type 1 member 1 [Varanus komodoensis]